jgi:predicted Zn-dependent peptidase
MGQERMSNRMLRMGTSEVYFDRVVPLAEIMAKIDAVTPNDIVRVAERVFPADMADLTIAAVGPFDDGGNLTSLPDDGEGDEDDGAAA